jgi:hypothetical protein
VRARIEHVFGAQENAPGGRLVRTIGIVRAKIKIGLQNVVYRESAAVAEPTRAPALDAAAIRRRLADLGKLAND